MNTPEINPDIKDTSNRKTVKFRSRTYFRTPNEEDHQFRRELGEGLAETLSDADRKANRMHQEARKAGNLLINN